MEVKTGALRNHLSQYLKRVRQTGETIVVLDCDVAVAEIRPFRGEKTEALTDIWGQREVFLASSGGLTDDFDLPIRQSDPRKSLNPLD